MMELEVAMVASAATAAAAVANIMNFEWCFRYTMCLPVGLPVFRGAHGVAACHNSHKHRDRCIFRVCLIAAHYRGTTEPSRRAASGCGCLVCVYSIWQHVHMSVTDRRLSVA